MSWDFSPKRKNPLDPFHRCIRICFVVKLSPLTLAVTMPATFFTFWLTRGLKYREPWISVIVVEEAAERYVVATRSEKSRFIMNIAAF
jgi:hypothetical protein